VYPFDTLDTLRYQLSVYAHDPSYLPRFLFVGIPVEEEDIPTLDTMYLPLNYLWYASDAHEPTQTHALAHPLRGLHQGDEWFVTGTGSYSSPNRQLRGRSTIEDVFPHQAVPTLHVFTLASLLREYKGTLPMSEMDWNKRLAAYFPEVASSGPVTPTAEDRAFGKKLEVMVTRRRSTLERLNEMIEMGETSGAIELKGIRQWILTWKKPVEGFEGAASFFYRTPATDKRPYLRLLPVEGTPITKLHVKGVVPLPTLEDPRILESWGEETSPDATTDVCVIKYVHHPSIGITPPLYGTFHVFHNGTMNLILQPPKQVMMLDPVLDFQHFRRIVGRVMEGLPQSLSEVEIHEMSLQAMIQTTSSRWFTRERLLQRLPMFQTVFTPIDSLPQSAAFLSLRYTAVSQYASENNVMQFITQTSMQKRLDGEELVAKEMIEQLEEQFQFTSKEASDAFKTWLEKRGVFTVTQPMEGEFVDSFHPGIDLHIEGDHPYYTIHIERINSYTNYVRILTLLSVLFVEDDGYFRDVLPDPGLARAEEEVKQEELLKEQQDQLGKQARVEQEEEVDFSMYDDVVAEDNSSYAAAEAASPVAVESSAPAPQRVVDPQSWFIKKLQEMDKRLFQYQTDTSVKNGYSRQCAGNLDRQPAVLTHEQYERMRQIYRDDPIFWVEYPLHEKEDPREPMGAEETILVMRYGSDVPHLRYYFCPEYFCLSDQIMVRPADFESNRDRKGGAKPPNTCPFCRGKLITNRRAPMAGHTVMKRKHAPGEKKYHKFIDFLKKTSHPEQLSLPCCFLSQSTLRVTDTPFKHLRPFLQKEQLEHVTEEDLDYGELETMQETGLLYDSHLYTMHKRAILESNKPLEQGNFGMCPPSVDAFFQQSSDTIVKRVTMQMKLLPNSQGMIRMGIQPSLNESLLSVMAVLLSLPTIQKVKERIIQTVVPRVFLNSHFGNLVLEFYDPRDGEALPATLMELKKWAEDELRLSLTSNNYYAVLRIYNAYHRFVQFIQDSSQRKDIRHLQPLLAEPGLFRPHGIQMLVLEEKEGEPITIRCPPFGLSMDRHRTNDIVFVSRHVHTSAMTKQASAYYEVYVYTNNRAARGAEQEKHQPKLRWDAASRAYWPPIIKKRIDEYMTQCQSRYRSLYSPQPSMDAMAMVPLSNAVEAVPSYPDGMVRDAYNHVMGLTYHVKAGSPYLVVLPVVDDGAVTLLSSMSLPHLYLDEEDVRLAPVEDVIQTYRTQFEPLFSLYPGYRVQYVVRRKIGNQICAVQLENGIYVPAAPSRNEAALAAFALPTVTVTQFQWEIDKEIAGKRWQPNDKHWNESLEDLADEKTCGTDSEVLRTVSYQTWQESYQQFRRMVSNWFLSEQSGPLVRKEVETIVFHRDLPEYERRKRLYLYLAPVFLSWFFEDKEEWDAGTSFLRKDCQVIDQADACTGTCYWKQDEEKCLLHVKEKTVLGTDAEAHEVSTAELYTKRVIDELVRFPGKRNQLRKGDISKVSTLTQPLHVGDQYILPESSPTWTQLLQMEWSRSIPEESKYYEEQSRPDEPHPREPVGDTTPELTALLGEASPFRLIVPPYGDPSQPLLPFTSILGYTLERLGLSYDARTFTRDAMIRYVKESSRPIGVVEGAPELTVSFVRPMTGSFSSVLILVFLPDRAGILMEEIGVPTVSVSAFSEPLQEAWKKAALVRIPQPPPAHAPEYVQDLPLLVKAKRRPRMAPKET